jgi:hypothetical protein
MVAARQIGYLGGWAVAVGIGAAIASQGTAHADSTGADSSAKTADASASTGVNGGPKRSPAASEASHPKRQSRIGDDIGKVAAQVNARITSATHPKPLSRIGDDIDKIAAQANARIASATRTITTSVAGIEPPTKLVVKPEPKPKLSPEEFEAQQVERLKKLYEPKRAATTPAPIAATTPTSTADVTAERDPNPFRADDPDPTDMPPTVLGAEHALLALTPEAVRPFVREGYEAAYRISQMVPYVNAPIPIARILPLLPGLLQGDASAKDSAQIIVNQLLLTTPQVSLLYYGYDEIADLLNIEDAAQADKVHFYATAWDTLDPLSLLHNQGNSGI